MPCSTLWWSTLRLTTTTSWCLMPWYVCVCVFVCVSLFAQQMLLCPVNRFTWLLDSLSVCVWNVRSLCLPVHLFPNKHVYQMIGYNFYWYENMLTFLSFCFCLLSARYTSLVWLLTESFSTSTQCWRPTSSSISVLHWLTSRLHTLTEATSFHLTQWPLYEFPVRLKAPVSTPHPSCVGP